MVETEDGWLITVFRLLGRNGERPAENSGKKAIYVHHGGGGDAAGWLFSWPVYLMDAGYDVWLGNQRGNIFGNTNVNDSTWTLKERWDWSHAEIAQIDLPAQIEKILEVTGKEKVTMAAYSEGTFISMYALASQQDYWADKVDRYISLATCTILPGMDYETEVAKYLSYEELGFYNTNGNDESTLDPAIACQYTNDEKLGCKSGKEDEGEEEYDKEGFEDDEGKGEAEKGGNAASMGMSILWAQTSSSERF